MRGTRYGPNNSNTAASQDPKDLTKATLDAAVSVAVSADLVGVASQIAAELTAFLSTLAGKQPPANEEDNCSAPDPSIAPLCLQQQLDWRTALDHWKAAQSDATNEFQTALQSWEVARATYDFAVTEATVTLQAATLTADNLSGKQQS